MENGSISAIRRNKKSQRNRYRLICNLHNRVLLQAFEKRIFHEVYRKDAQQVAGGKKRRSVYKMRNDPYNDRLLYVVPWAAITARCSPCMVGHQYGMPHLIDSEKLFVFWIGACGFQWANNASDGELEYELFFLTNMYQNKKNVSKISKKV